MMSLEIAELQCPEQALQNIAQHANHQLPWTDKVPVMSFPRVFAVRGPVTFATGDVWNNRRPARSPAISITCHRGRPEAA